MLIKQQKRENLLLLWLNHFCNLNKKKYIFNLPSEELWHLYGIKNFDNIKTLFKAK